MKKLSALMIALLLALSLAACASNTGGDKTMKVKCPACGYEFETPMPRP